MKYEARTFTIPELRGISQKNIEEHLGLYAGYVKNTNHILESLSDDSIDAYAKSEMRRRLAFEFNGMKNHEYYFAALEGGSLPLDPKSKLGEVIDNHWGSFENWLADIKDLAKTRGIGWSVLWYDQDTGNLINGWVDEQHLGLLNSAQFVVGIDMWEHAFVADYQPSGKGQYIDDYFDQINWGVIANRFDLYKNLV